jgi:drug/metabolite transporter (DMT)-like permease
MLGAALAFSAMIAFLRLATEAIHPFEVAFFRNAFGLAFMLPWILGPGLAVLRTSRVGGHMVRALSGLVAMLSWFVGLSLMPLAEAVALSFTAPMFATVGAALFLHEEVRARRWTATAVGFLGVLVVVRPDAGAVQLPALLVLLSAAFGACSALLVKSLSRTEASNAIVSYMVIYLTPMSLVPALFVWEWPDLAGLAALIAVAGLGTIGHLCYTRAMKAADASAVMPLEYLRLPLVAVIGYFAFGEVIDAWSAVGAAIIVLSALYIARREIIAARQRRPHDPGPIAAGAAKEKL